MHLFALLMFFVSAAAWSAESASAPPLACPQCGQWDLVTAAFGLAGEQIVITPEHVDIPVLGSFCAHVLSEAIAPEQSVVRAYRVSLNLAAGDTCAVPGPDSLRMDVVLPGAWLTEASVISIAVYQASTGVAVFTATGWNGMRNDPCTVGGGSPGADCATIAHAATFKRLAYLLYALQEGRPPRQEAQLARRFDATRFANAVAAFCTRREIQSAAGDGRFWSMACQNERLEAKLRDWQAWSTCTAMPHQRCTMPTESFDRSKRER